MYGAFSGFGYGAVALGVLLLVALAFLASPLIAVGIALVVGVGLLIGMSALRRRSEVEDGTAGGAPDTHSSSPRGSTRSGGEPASGEG